ncbi:MAG TPA: hypothetical protein VJN18_32555 [Polyangiaceae bacterium]|nr:hypothetical protein [Polyangiaceae bacterium]
MPEPAPRKLLITISGPTVPNALRALAIACGQLADALDDEPIGRRASNREKSASPSQTLRIEPPKLNLEAARALDTIPDREGLTKTETKILTALAQAGHALSAVQIGTRCGLSSKGGAFAKSLTDLRSAEYIVGGASRIEVTDEGIEALGEFARLPEGQALFDYWCAKTGSTGAKILCALRQRHREHLGPASGSELGAATGLSHKGGAFAATLTKLRKLELIEGGGSAMVLSSDMQRAADVTIGVFDRQSGKSVRVDRGGRVL